jgi:hypothetical protein
MYGISESASDTTSTIRRVGFQDLRKRSALSVRLKVHKVHSSSHGVQVSLGR